MAGLISEYHHAAHPQLRACDPLFERYTLTDVVVGYALGATWIARLLALPRAAGAWRQTRLDRRG